MPRGGRRPGAGRKPKPKPDNGLASVIQHPSSQAAPPATPAPIEVFDPPSTLPEAARQVWQVQATHAFAARTLSRATALAFERYCRIVVIEQHEAESTARGGANHRGLLKQINAYELQFLLVPCGKPLPMAVAPAVDADADFFGGTGAGSRG